MVFMTIDLDDKHFRPLVNTVNGEVSQETIFHYHQIGDIFFADYQGGEILKGQLIGKIVNSEFLEFVYQHLNSDKEIMTGKCKSYPELNEQGKLILREYWQWTCKDNSYPQYSHRIKPEELTKDMMIDFVEYLQSRSVGEGAKGHYQRFKKVIHYAIDHDVMVKNPCKGVVCKIDEQALRKDVLSSSEVEQLLQTIYTGQNPEIRRAFMSYGQIPLKNFGSAGLCKRSVVRQVYLFPGQ